MKQFSFHECEGHAKAWGMRRRKKIRGCGGAAQETLPCPSPTPLLFFPFLPRHTPHPLLLFCSFSHPKLSCTHCTRRKKMTALQASDGHIIYPVYQVYHRIKSVILKSVFFFGHPLGRLHAVQKGIKIDSKGKESKQFLLQLMDQLEAVSAMIYS